MCSFAVTVPLMGSYLGSEIPAPFVCRECSSTDKGSSYVFRGIGKLCENCSSLNSSNACSFVKGDDITFAKRPVAPEEKRAQDGQSLSPYSSDYHRY